MINTIPDLLKIKTIFEIIVTSDLIYSLLVSWPGKSKLLKWDPEMDFRMKRYGTRSTDILFLISSTHYKYTPLKARGER